MNARRSVTLKIHGSRVLRPSQHRPHKTHRCHAGGRQDPNNFLVWGQNMLRKMNKAGTQPDVEAESSEASERISSGSNAKSCDSLEGKDIQHPEVDPIDQELNAELERRREDYRHLVFCGRDVTTEYPESETPTWDQWLNVITESRQNEDRLHDLYNSLQTAIDDEDYFTAAELKKDMDALKAQDVVENFLQDYKLAIEEEDFSKAGELLDGCSIDLCGWWTVNTPNNDIVPHILRVDKAYNKYKFTAFAPDCLAGMHGITSSRMGGGNESDPVKPSTEEYCANGHVVAELHFQQFPNSKEESGSRIYTLATASPPRIENLVTTSEDGTKLEMYSAEVNVSDTASNDDLMSSIMEKILQATDELAKSDGQAVIDVEQSPTNIEDRTSRDSEEARSQDAGSESSSEETSPVETTELTDFYRWSESTNELSSSAGLRPLNLLRTEKDKIMLVSSRMANSLPEEASPDELDLLGDESREASDADKSDSENSGRVQVITIDGKTDAKEVVARLKDVLSGNSPRTGSKSLLDEAEKNFRSQMEDKTKRRKMMSRLAKHVRAMLKSGASGQDQLAQRGLFIGMFGAHGPEVIQVQRVIGPDGKEYVEGIKLTGDANVPAGKISFRAGISREDKMPSTRYLPPELGIRARYKGEGHVANAGFKNPRWVDGELWHLSSNNMLGQTAEIGFLYTIGENKILTPLNRLHLDTPLQDQLR